jgi:hypothetical protein
MNRLKISIYFLLITGLVACSYSKKFSQEFFIENQAMLQSIKQRYRDNYKERPFSLEIKDKDFQRIGLEILTDSVRYIYDFHLDDPALVDTMIKYQFNVEFMQSLIEDMRQTHCTWLTNLEYYENLKKQQLVFLSIRDRRLESLLKKDKYFTLAFFENRQPFDEKGRLLDRANRKELRKINGAVFFRMKDDIAYAMSSDFR